MGFVRTGFHEKGADPGLVLEKREVKEDTRAGKKTVGG